MNSELTDEREGEILIKVRSLVAREGENVDCWSVSPPKFRGISESRGSRKSAPISQIALPSRIGPLGKVDSVEEFGLARFALKRRRPIWCKERGTTVCDRRDQFRCAERKY